MDQQARTGAQLRSQGFAQAQQLSTTTNNNQAQLTGQGQTTGALGQTVGQWVTSWSWTTRTTNGCTRY